jgi:hypothetical protein
MAPGGWNLRWTVACVAMLDFGMCDLRDFTYGGIVEVEERGVVEL